MLGNLSIRGRLLATVIMAIGFLTLLAGVNLYGQQKSGAALADVQAKAVLPLMAVQEIDNDLREVRFRTAGAVLDIISMNGARNHLKEVRERLPGAWQQFRTGFDAAAAPGEERQLVEDIGKELDGFKAYLDLLDAAYQKEDKAALTSLLDEKWPPIQKKLVKPLSQLIPARAAAVKTTFEISTAEGRKLSTLSIASYFVCVAGLALLMLPLIGSLARAIGDLKGVLSHVAEGDLNCRPDTSRQDELGDMARSLNATIERLHEIIGGVQGAAHTLADRSEQLSREIDDVMERGAARSDIMSRAAASIDQMNASARDIAAGSGQVAEASGAARGIAVNGNERMEASIAATQRVETAVDGSAAIIEELSAATDRVNQVTLVIREIADQTNLLALNAAIEAARAGEQGRGFAVVADEVRKLAERTSASTADIAATVETIRGKTASAVDAMSRARHEVADGVRFNRETRETLDGIVGASERVTGLARQIADATRQQMAASDNTASDMAQASQMSSENSASLQRLDAVTREVAQMAQELQQVVGRFRV
ncbi:MAG: methyl-accepting chemotaxis protein [Rhodocyclaceae bacterium]|nr:methyl-accepting chemotaxis protein [Rhodocyclaceae bacterium]